MKKTLQIAALLLAGYSATAQDFAYKIPRNAQAVATLKSGHLVDLLSVKEFNQSVVGKMILKDLSRNENQPFTSILDFGINLNSNIYYYNRVTDSISYHCVLLPLADAQKLEHFITSKHRHQTIERHGNLSQIVPSKYDKSMLVWNDQLALIVMAHPKKAFFEDQNNRDRYGLPQEANEEEAVTTVVESATEVVAYDSAIAVVEEPSIAYEEVKPPAPKKKKGKKTAAKYNHKQRVENVAIAEEAPVMVDVPAYDVSDRKDSIAMAWTQDYAERVFRKKEDATSILDNENYRASYDKNAAASIYVANLQDMYGDFLGGGMSTTYLSKMMRGYRNINANLYLDEKTARITTDVELSENKAAMYRNIYSRKMNPEFVNYVNSDKVIGFIGYSLDTKAYLEEMPKLLQHTYGSYMGRYGKSYKEEMDLGADLFSLLLDEEAVSKVVKGDALFLFNGVSSKTVTYKTYDYNSDNYDRKEVEKTKTETLPDFLLMMTSEDTRLIHKLLKYGIEKGEVTVTNGIYSLSGKSMKSPMVVHVLFKNGIIFLGTSLRDMQDINEDRYEAHITKAQKSLLLDNTMSVYFNPRKLEGKISQKDIGSLRKWTQFNSFLNNTGVLYAHTNGIKGNVVSGEMVAEVPEENGNALQYFFHLIDDVASKD